MENEETTVAALGETRAQRNERSRIMGEYYRDLATNYPEYDRTKDWPSPPYPPQHWVTTDAR